LECGRSHSGGADQLHRSGGRAAPDVEALLTWLDGLYRSKSSIARIELQVTGPVMRLRFVQPSSGGSDRTLFIRHQEIEEATVGEAQRQFCPPSVKVQDIQIVDGYDPSFDLEVGRDGFLFGVGEVLVHGEVVMDPP
jgi:hypothetical protein